jgi:hypothetical protein
LRTLLTINDQAIRLMAIGNEQFKQELEV